MTTLDERELHRQEFLGRFMPEGYICAHDVYMDWKPLSFHPSTDTMTEIFREYLNLLEETPPEIPNLDDLESPNFNDVNELVLGYLDTYARQNEQFPVGDLANEIAQKIDRLLLPHEQVEELDYYEDGVCLELSNDDYKRFDEVRGTIRYSKAFQLSQKKSKGTGKLEPLFDKVRKFLGRFQP